MTYRRWVPPVMWAATILLINSIPGSDLGVVAPYSFPGADKMVHASLYAVLGWLGGKAAGGEDLSFAGAAGTLASIAMFGAADEWHQQFVAGRAADPMDWLADMLGAGTALLLLVWRQRAQTA
ncbi:MAG: VanZ family protein [Gemmatimonadaceae bacterium]